MWVESANYKGYLVSDRGEVVSLRQGIWFEMRQRIHKNYMHVRLFGGDKIPVARLVANAFYGPSKLQVDHIDGNCLNNSLENLEYVTPEENLARAYRRRGLKFSDETVRHIRKLKGQISAPYLARKYNTKEDTIRNIMNHKAYKHVL